MGLIARLLERDGIPTVMFANMPRRVQMVRPPRALLVRQPNGRMTGMPGDSAGQRAAVRAALALLAQTPTPQGIAVWADAASS